MTGPLDGPAPEAQPTDAPASPDGLTVPPVPVVPQAGPRRIAPWRIGLVVGAIVVLAGGAAIAFAASPSPSPSGGGTPPGPDNGWVAPNGMGPGMMGGFGMKGGGRGQVGRDITITAINGSNLSLKTEDGWTRTITVSSSTKITKGGQTIQSSDLKVGDQVVFQQTRNSDGTYAIDAITVVVPTVAGTVKDVTSSGFTLTARNGLTWTVTVNGSTVYTLGSAGTSGSKSDLTAGSDVVVQGTQGSGNTITASSVRIGIPRVGGQVTAKNGSTLTVKRADGTTFTIKTTSTTTYRVAGVTNPTLADITVGMTVMAEGTQGSDGSITATVVAAGKGGMNGFPGQGGGRGHGWGKGGWGPNGAQPSPSASPSTGGSTG